jgi:antitoxin (DNA-binding transcriptional repressor) of toxin-antitoxin stability system
LVLLIFYNSRLAGRPSLRRPQFQPLAPRSAITSYCRLDPDRPPCTAAGCPDHARCIRELKAGLSRILAQAHAGEVIEVTSHDRLIARIVGIPDTGEAGLHGLVASGAAAWSGGKPAFACRSTGRIT